MQISLPASPREGTGCRLKEKVQGPATSTPQPLDHEHETLKLEQPARATERFQDRPRGQQVKGDYAPITDF